MTTSQTIVITGASDGIGAAAARRIRATLPDTDLVLVGRNPAKTQAVATEVDAPFHVADFSRLDEVRNLAAELLTLPRIDVLANNAGGIFDGPSRTVDGFELTWQVNYLAPYLLTNLLRQTLLDSRASVVGTSSIASVLFSRFDPTDPETFDAFSPNRAYGNAKLATNWFAKALHDRFHDRGLSTVAFHPGVIATNFGAESSGILHHAYNLAGDRMFTPAEQGGMNLAYFLTGVPGIHWESGEYYNDKRRPGIQRRAARDRDLIDSVFTETAEVLGVQW
ncbi:SDR family NAD(P)-dependent oxidoreductase [Corynebacterium suedekumii]|uniref:SDR family NAD(P)-dependent oxidoreductase n=1 Tax=Corynebacterium suedekumii TaxID=3049801 RepID=A0ABY8VJU6_9CORY|nr:SDR family NAD(P)-dependent oxidoreductase [Corynebacterium suedekumii]WIM69261.1 SDR family NAD(P)-dependent oxidoreductase [Corynebacterium suedekumii]